MASTHEAPKYRFLISAKVLKKSGPLAGMWVPWSVKRCSADMAGDDLQWLREQGARDVRCEPINE